jgi:signal transduction histidine kinase
VLLALPAIYAASQLTRLRQIAFELRGQHAAAFRALGGAQIELTEFERFVRSYVAVSGPALRNDARHALTRAAAHVDALEETGYAAPAADARARIAAHRGWLEELVRLMEAGRADAAVAALDLLDSELTETQRTLDALADTIDRQTVDKVLEARDISQFAATATLLAAAACVTLALLLGAWSARTITAPIQRLRTAMAAVAEGSFATPAGLPYERGDEVGGLARSFRWMTRRLGTLERLRAEYTGVVTHDLRTPVNVIAGYADLLEEGSRAPGARAARRRGGNP